MGNMPMQYANEFTYTSIEGTVLVYIRSMKILGKTCVASRNSRLPMRTDSKHAHVACHAPGKHEKEIHCACVNPVATPIFCHFNIHSDNGSKFFVPLHVYYVMMCKSIGILLI